MQQYNLREEFQGRYTARRKTTRYIVVHHAAALYPTHSGYADVRAVAHYHTNVKGWPGIGYHIALAEETNGGPIARYDLSDLSLQRAHVAYQNHQSVGVACLTNFTGMPEQKWIDALATTIRDLKRIYPRAEIVGHKEITVPGWGSACPGPRWFDWKPQLLALVERPPSVPGLTFRAAPRTDKATFGRVLREHYSPAARLADTLYDIIVRAGLDPAVALAFFAHESSYGTKGICFDYDTKSWGNVRTAMNERRGIQLGIPGRGNFFAYHTWEEGLIDWCERINRRYIDRWGLRTVEQAIPKYAPSFDGNNEQRYIQAVRDLVSSYQATPPQPPVNGGSSAQPARPQPARPSLQRYRVANWVTAGAVVRQGPGRNFPISKIGVSSVILERGREVRGNVVAGAPYNGSSEWVHIVEPAAWGFTHKSLLKEVT